MLKKLFAATGVAAAVMASPVAAQGLKYRAVTDPFETFQRPAAGVETEAEIGQAVVSAGRVSPGIEVTATAYTRAGGNKVEVPPGVYRLVASSETGRFFKAETAPIILKALGMSGGWPEGGVYIPSDPAKPAEVYYRNDFGMTFHGPIPDLQFNRVDTATLNGGFRRELIYGGVAKGVVSLSYREYSNDFARPAFSQALSYDLADGDEIGYRGARLKILKATNTSIRFVVLKPMDQN